MKLNISNIQKLALPEAGGLAVSLATGFNPYAVWSIGKKLLSSRSEDKWLDWEGKKIDKTYRNDLSKCLIIDLIDDRLILPQVILFDNTKSPKALTEFKIEIKQRGTNFKVKSEFSSRNDSIVDDYQNLKRTLFRRESVSLFDWECARLFNYKEKTSTFVFQKSTYFDYLKTNLAMDNKGNGTYSLREEIHARNSQLMPLSRSPLANHLGINFLILTHSGEFIIPKRSDTVLIRPQELSPSASGSLEFQDVSLKKPESLGVADIYREVREELTEEIGSSLCEPHLLGLTRELIRGGKPELFLFAKSTMDKEQILKSIRRGSKSQDEISQTHFLSINPFHTKTINYNNVSEFKNSFLIALNNLNKIGKISIPLFTNLAFYYLYKINTGKG